MPTLCIPRRKSILIETIHHSRRPTDVLLFLRLRGAARAYAGSKHQSRSLRSDRVLLLVVVPLSIRLPPRFNFTGFRGISAERSVLVYLLCPPPPRRSSHPFFTARGIMRQQDSPAFAEFRRRNAGLLADDIAFRLCLWNLWSVANFD